MKTRDTPALEPFVQHQYSSTTPCLEQSNRSKSRHWFFTSGMQICPRHLAGNVVTIPASLDLSRSLWLNVIARWMSKMKILSELVNLVTWSQQGQPLLDWLWLNSVENHQVEISDWTRESCRFYVIGTSGWPCWYPCWHHHSSKTLTIRLHSHHTILLLCVHGHQWRANAKWDVTSLSCLYWACSFFKLPYWKAGDRWPAQGRTKCQTKLFQRN